MRRPRRRRGDVIGRSAGSRNVRVVRFNGGEARSGRDALALEEPLEIRLSWSGPAGPRMEPVAVTMRTPGDDFDLVAGFLFAESVVSRPEDVAELSYCRGEESQQYNVVEARLRPGVDFDAQRLRRHFYTSSSCGVCGKASLDAVESQGCRPLPDDGFRVDRSLLGNLPGVLREGQGVFERTGGLHAAGLFTATGACTALREDVGRHNAVDKVLGYAFLHRQLPARERILVVSGRTSFEIVQKAVMAQVPVVVAVGAPSSLAVALAARFGQTLVGFARGDGFNAYSRPERIS